MEQPNRFQKLVAEAKQRISEISPAEARRQVDGGDAVLIDVREESDWREGHAKGAKHLSRGVIELEIDRGTDSRCKNADRLLLRRRKPFRAGGGKLAENGI